VRSQILVLMSLQVCRSYSSGSQCPTGANKAFLRNLYSSYLPTGMAMMSPQSEGKVTATVHAHHDMGHRYQSGRPLTQGYSKPFP